MYTYLELINTVIAVIAFIMSSVSLVWQAVANRPNLKVEFIKVYKLEEFERRNYIFRMTFANKSPSPISVTKILLKNEKGYLDVEYDERILIKKYKRW